MLALDAGSEGGARHSCSGCANRTVEIYLRLRLYLGIKTFHGTLAAKAKHSRVSSHSDISASGRRALGGGVQFGVDLSSPCEKAVIGGTLADTDSSATRFEC